MLGSEGFEGVVGGEVGLATDAGVGVGGAEEGGPGVGGNVGRLLDVDGEVVDVGVVEGDFVGGGVVGDAGDLEVGEAEVVVGAVEDACAGVGEGDYIGLRAGDDPGG